MSEFLTPILFIIFNRPENAQKVFNQIKKIKPQYLYIHADGPRENHQTDVKLCRQTRKIINQIDWDCEVKTLFQDKNLGVKYGGISAINWFFENVEQGIILEDDTVPSESFFGFCKNLLEKYKNDNRIMMISGTNFISPEKMQNYDYDYFFSNLSKICGWATWKRAWNLYDPQMILFPEFIKKNNLKYKFPDVKNNVINRMEKWFKQAYKKELECWDYQWFLSVLQNNGLAIIPSKNLITNIGVNGGHFENAYDEPILFIKNHEIDVKNLKHPEFIMPNFFFQKLFLENSDFKRPLRIRIKNFIKNSIVKRFK